MVICSADRTLTHIEGNTFLPLTCRWESPPGTGMDVTGATIRADLRTSDTDIFLDALVGIPDELPAPVGTFTLYPSVPRPTWPIGTYTVDILITQSDGTALSTPSFLLVVADGVTQ